MTESDQDQYPGPHKHRRWSRRRNKFGLRNGQLVLLILVAIVIGVAVSLLTADMGLR